MLITYQIKFLGVFMFLSLNGLQISPNSKWQIEFRDARLGCYLVTNIDRGTSNFTTFSFVYRVYVSMIFSICNECFPWKLSHKHNDRETENVILQFSEIFTFLEMNETCNQLFFRYSVSYIWNQMSKTQYLVPDYTFLSFNLYTFAKLFRQFKCQIE